MTPPDFTFHVLCYGLVVLGGFGVLWFFYDRRDRALYDVQRRKITFHCIRCDKPFGVRSTIERVMAKLEGKHWMYQGSAQRLDVLKKIGRAHV